MPDLYKILGIDENANPREIKKAYRLKAKSLHPDINHQDGAEEKFQTLLQAYLILSDAEKRKTYDRGFEIPEVEVPDRTKYPPPHAYKSRQAFNRFGVHGNSKAVKIDYGQYSNLVRLSGIVAFLFAFTFLIDFLTYHQYDQVNITSIQSKATLTRKVDDLGIVIVKAGNLVFEKKREINNEFQINEIIDVRKSMLYGFIKYKRASRDEFQEATILSTIVHFAAVLIYISSLIAIFSRKSPEIKFNAALIAVFFSIALLAFVLLT